MLKNLFRARRKESNRDYVRRLIEADRRRKDAPFHRPAYRVNYVLPNIDECMNYHISFAELDTEPFKKVIPKIFRSLGVDVNDEVTAVCGTMVTRFTATLRNHSHYDKVKKTLGTFKSYLGEENLVITQDGSNIYIDLPYNCDYLALGDMLQNKTYRTSNDFLLAIGRGLDGKDVFADIADLKHVLVAGTTGSGKSVFLQNLMLSLLCRHTPADTEILIIDPKRVEFAPCQCAVISEPWDALHVLNRLTEEMDARYNLMARAGVRNIEEYNRRFPERRIVRTFVFIDELSDLMKQTNKQAEAPIVRIAQKARACGIHLIIATQYPVRDVVTGLIKANMPTKVCFAVTSGVHSRVMLDRNGAEKLLGKGDMLFQTEKDLHPRRLQAPIASDIAIENVVYSCNLNRAP